MRRWTTDTVGAYLDFSCGKRFGENAALVALQREGVAAICTILRKKNVAYLADEVGLGKTMQGLGVVSCLLADHPAARVLVIAPREVVQNGWKNEYDRFVSYVAADRAMPTLATFDNLREWLRDGVGPGVSLLRHPSFSRPVYRNDGTWEDAVAGLDLPDIHTLRQRVRVTPTDKGASWDHNLAFARDVNAWLTQCGIRFDLVVVDEAQCLRNLDGQQTNTVLLELLKGRVDRWLFLSATPAHSGAANIATVMNKYPGRGQLIDPALGGTALRAAMKPYMVRRLRTFTVQDRQLHKRDYRLDDEAGFALRCTGVLDTLSIAMVQKRLVGMLEDGDGFRFRTGFMASFESLEDSLKGRTATDVPSNAPDGETPPDGSDFFGERHARTDDGKAPDEGFVTRISTDFHDRFKIGLSHPKVDGVERDLARTVWGDGSSEQPGGTKTVVFCRRLSSVRILRERLMKRYLRGIEDRCRDTWRMAIDWEKGLTDLAAKSRVTDAGASQDEPVEPEDKEGAADDDLNRLRAAQQPGKWLYNFRSSFNDGQRHALFFELNWFRWLCAVGGVDPEKAADAVPAGVWRDSAAFATRSGKRYRRSQARFLAWRCLERHAQEVFGLDAERGAVLAHALRPVLHDDKPQPASDVSDAAPDRELLLFESLWTRVELLGLMCLPAPPGGTFDSEAIHWRKVVATALSQYLRLTDALVDLRCAQRRGTGTDPMLDKFVGWLGEGSAGAMRLLRVCREWCTHHRLIFSAAVGDLAPQRPAELAAMNAFEFMTSFDPVVAVTGGSGGHKRAVCQFNTPGMPYVMVGTDTIREGVNLHLFCDRVMHYGLPWTAGDLEQRIGRVDRFFGRIERRLHHESSDAKLEVAYPHLADTIEALQIKNLRARRREAEEAVDGDFTDQVDDGRVEIDMPMRASTSDGAAARRGRPAR
jgi:hypothetical protein